VQSLTLGSTNAFTTHQNDDLRFNITRNDAALKSVSTDLGGATPLDVSALPGFNGGTGESLAFYLAYGSFPGMLLRHAPSSQSQYNVTDTYDLALGRHNLRAGVDWRRLETQPA